MINLCLDLLMEANLKVIPAQITSKRETPEPPAEETPRRQEPTTHQVTNLGSEDTHATALLVLSGHTILLLLHAQASTAGAWGRLRGQSSSPWEHLPRFNSA